VDEINVTFDSLDPVEADFHGIKLFVAGLLDGEKFDSSELVDIVLEQSGRVGTVVKVKVAEILKSSLYSGFISKCTWQLIFKNDFK
jgi:hypothetical protein